MASDWVADGPRWRCPLHEMPLARDHDDTSSYHDGWYGEWWRCPARDCTERKFIKGRIMPIVMTAGRCHYCQDWPYGPLPVGHHSGPCTNVE